MFTERLEQMCLYVGNMYACYQRDTDRLSRDLTEGSCRMPGSIRTLGILVRNVVVSRETVLCVYNVTVLVYRVLNTHTHAHVPSHISCEIYKTYIV